MANNVTSTNAIMLELNEVLNVGHGIYTNGREYIFNVDGSVIVVQTTESRKTVTYDVYSRQYNCPMGYSQLVNIDNVWSEYMGGMANENYSRQSLQKSIFGAFWCSILIPIAGCHGCFTVTLLAFPTTVTGIELRAYPLTVHSYDSQFSLMTEFTYHSPDTNQLLHGKLQHINAFMRGEAAVSNEPSPTVDSRLSVLCHSKGWKDECFPWRKGNGYTDDPFFRTWSEGIYITPYKTILFTMGPLLFAYPFDDKACHSPPVIVEKLGHCFVSSYDSTAGVTAICQQLLTTGAFNSFPHRTVSALAAVTSHFSYTIEKFVEDNVKQNLQQEEASEDFEGVDFNKENKGKRLDYPARGLKVLYRLAGALYEDVLDVPHVREALKQSNKFLQTSWKHK